MEMNRGEAEKCRDIAKRFLREGKWGQAIKFFDKSHRMYPLPGVEAMRERAQQELDKELAGAGAASSHNSGPASGVSSSGVRHRAATTPASSSSDDSLRPYSAEQEQMVRKIRGCRNHYEVLGVAKNAEDNEIKKAYRKLALKLHPDKNSAPGAEDAFKAVGKAFTILSDPDKRADYDRFGDAGPQQQAARAQRRYQEEDISPEEIFNMFFGGGFRPRRAPHPRQQQQRQQGHAENRGGMANFVQFLPLLLIFIMSLLSIQSPPEVPFSMQPTQQYNIERVTQMSNVVKGIPYYVDREFEQRYTSHYRDLARVEQMVEQYHVAQLSDACESQKQRQKRMIYRARNSRSENREAEMRRALEMKMPACEELRNLRRSRRF